MTAERKRLVTQARLARGERGAALNALAGRLAHQMRNPLAAIRAACGGLQSEITDPDHRETLTLTLREVDRMLKLVSATVQATTAQAEKPRVTDLAGEIRGLIEILNDAHGDLVTAAFPNDRTLPCAVPRTSFLVAVFSLLEYILENLCATRITARISESSERVRLVFEAIGAAAAEMSDGCGPGVAGNGSSSVGLLVTERFARDVDGHLTHVSTDDGQHTYTLDLPYI